MEEKKQPVRKVVTYNYSKVIKDIEVSPAFIPGLQNVYYRYISEFYNDYSKIGELTEKFHNIISGKLKGNDKTLTPIEHELYTIYSLTHLLKSFAKQQGLEIEQELPVDEEKLAELAEIAKTKESAGEGLAFLAQEIAKLS
jgi:hypothetical protein|tara:strand:- start:539 stop:961 length:423 start_codon:yes stop_codon:yes gene_type:complete